MRPRLLHLLIATAVLLLVFKLDGVWQGFATMAEAAPTGSEDPGHAAEEGSAASGQGKMVPQGSAGANAAGPKAADALPSADLAADPFSLTDAEIELLQSLAERREELDRRASQIAHREALLVAAEQRIDRQIVELKELQKTIEALVARHDEQEDARLRSLVKIYESMKPKDAARIFEQLDMVVLLEVIERMRERKSAPILAEMNPNRAKSITLELAQRGELPGEVR